MIRRKLTSREVADRALAFARRIVPESRWYLTNESGQWEIVEKALD